MPFPELSPLCLPLLGNEMPTDGCNLSGSILPPETISSWLCAVGPAHTHMPKSSRLSYLFHCHFHCKLIQFVLCSAAVSLSAGLHFWGPPHLWIHLCLYDYFFLPLLMLYRSKLNLIWRQLTQTVQVTDNFFPPLLPRQGPLSVSWDAFL